MKCVKVQSDYSPCASLQLIQTDDGDVIFKILGNGEMRIATSGGQFHGEQLVAICGAANALLAALSGEVPDLMEDEPRIKTYADRIRAESDEGLAQLLYRVSHDARKPLNQEQVLKRLQEPCEESDYEKDC